MNPFHGLKDPLYMMELHLQYFVLQFPSLSVRILLIFNVIELFGQLLLEKRSLTAFRNCL